MTHPGFGVAGMLPGGWGLPAARAEPSWHSAPERVAAPRHASQLVRLIENARRRGMPIAVVGRDGVPLDGVMTVDLSSWQHVEQPSRELLSVTAEPGASFRQILARTLPLGLVPKALPFDLDASLGGTLSGVGVGSTSHRHGFLAAQVAYAQVVLGTGAVVHTGPRTERDAYDCVLGGAGRFGVITSVELELEPAPRALGTYLLGYADCRSLVRDLMALGNDPLVLRLLAGRSSLWASSGQAPYSLAVTLAAPHGRLDRAALPTGLTHVGRQGPWIEELEQLVQAQHLLAGASGPRAARWVALLPDTPALPLVLEHVLASMESSQRCVVSSLTRGSHDPTTLALPATQRVVVVSGRARQSTSNEPAEPDDLRALTELHRRVYRAGGRLCPSGWLARRDPAFWRMHYGPSHTRLALLKRFFDPAHILVCPSSPLSPGAP